jgi:hypothetical protein
MNVITQELLETKNGWNGIQRLLKDKARRSLIDGCLRRGAVR